MEQGLVVLVAIVAGGMLAARDLTHRVRTVTLPHGRRRRRLQTRSLAKGALTTGGLLAAASISGLGVELAVGALACTALAVAAGLHGATPTWWPFHGRVDRRLARLADDLAELAEEGATRPELVQRGLDGVVDAMGGSAGFVTGPTGTVAAVCGMGEPAASRTHAQAPRGGIATVSIAGSARRVCTATIDGAYGTSLLAVVTDQLSPTLRSAHAGSLRRFGERLADLVADATPPAPPGRAEMVAALADRLRVPVSTVVGLVGHVTTANGIDTSRIQRVIDDVMGAEHLRRDQTLAAAHRVALRDAIAVAAATVPAPDHSLTVTGPSVDAVVDPAGVHRIVTLLVRNAVAHTPPGTSIELWLEPTDPEHVTICVDDDGPGIPLDLGMQVFDPLVRGDGDRDGAGLGLYVVSEVAKLHGGRAWWEPRTGGGSSFRARLRCCPPLGGPDADLDLTVDDHLPMAPTDGAPAT